METSKEDLRLINFNEFYDEYFRMWTDGMTQREAYNTLEHRYMVIFGQRRYSGFESFYNTYSKKLKI